MAFLPPKVRSGLRGLASGPFVFGGVERLGRAAKPWYHSEVTSTISEGPTLSRSSRLTPFKR